MAWYIGDLERARQAARSGMAWSALAFAGTALSGPVGLLVVGATKPQPPWSDAATFAAAWHPVQLLPYAFGFLLVTGMAGLLATLHVLAPSGLRPRTAPALVFAGAFTAVILVNYAIQTTFVPALVRGSGGEADALIATFTMANPSSLAWALEMWGYAALGMATWLVAPVLRDGGGRAGRWAAALFVVNGPASVGAAAATVLWPGWVLTAAGLVAFGVWNIVVVSMTLLAWLALRRRGVAPEGGVSW